VQTHLGLCGAACSGCFLTVFRMLALDLQAARADGGLNGPAGTGMEQDLTRTGIRFLHRGSRCAQPTADDCPGWPAPAGDVVWPTVATAMVRREDQVTRDARVCEYCVQSR